MTQPYVLAHPLRRLTLAAFPPAFILSIVDAALSGPVRIAGFPPLFVSAIISTILICRKRRNTEGGRRRLGVPILLLIFDTLLAAGVLTFLIFTWIRIEHGWEIGRAVLKAYATVPYLLIFFIHAYLAILNLINMIDQPRTCPRCDGDLYSRPADSTPGFGPSQESRGVYRNLHEGEQSVGRPSLDSDADEDARLLGDQESRVGFVKKLVTGVIGGAGKDEIKVQIV